MHMIQLNLDPARLVRFAYSHGHNHGADEDHGYAAHAWLAATFGDLAPKPFRLVERKSGDLCLLAYARGDKTELCEHALTFADPQALAVCDMDFLESKPMPESWAAGRRLDFEVRACPVSRGERERDVYLVALDRAKAQGGEPPARETVYLEWLKRQFGETAELEQQHDANARQARDRARLAAFRRVATTRRANGKGAVRGAERVERPDALLQGTLIVRDGEAFGRLLARGIGRHRAFGFGMLLLRPTSVL